MQRDGPPFEPKGPRERGWIRARARTAASVGASPAAACAATKGDVRQMRQVRRTREPHSEPEEAVAHEELREVEPGERVDHETAEQHAPTHADVRRRRPHDQLPVHLADDEELRHEDRQDQPRLPPKPVTVPVPIDATYSYQ